MSGLRRILQFCYKFPKRMPSNYFQRNAPITVGIPRLFHYFNQCLLKDKNRGKDKMKLKHKPIPLQEELIDEVMNSERYKRDLQDTVDWMKEEYIKHLSLRSVAGTIELIPVKFEEKDYTIQDLAQINRKNPNMLALNLSVFPQTIPAILEAVNNSGMNLNPQQDGTSIYIPIPKLTTERREKLSNNAHALFVKCKQHIKEVQNKYIRKLENKNVQDSMSIDKINLIKEQMTAVADKYVAQAEKMKNNKQKELKG